MCAAGAKLASAWDGPRERQYQLWIDGARLVLVEVYPDGSPFVWRPLDDTNNMQTTVDALRAYLAPL